jgi:tetratricopeptide (TPR) repeat protein
VRRALLATLAALAGLATSGLADTILLTNGRVIEADRTWDQGTQLMYEKNGGTFGLPRSLVLRVERRAAPEPTSDPDVQHARERLSHDDPAEAVRLLQAALLRDPRSLAALQALAQAYLKLGDARSAGEAADRALRIDERNPASLALKGDALAAQGDRTGADFQYRRSLSLRPDPEVEGKLGSAAPTVPGGQAASQAKPAQFRVRYDGGVNEPLGMAVVRALSDAYAEFARRLGGSPDEPITVVLQTEARFQGGAPPAWADGINEGTIRVAVQGLEEPTPHLVRLLRHELAHSFIAARTAGNCPTWLQEGIAQWLEGGDPNREDANLALVARNRKLIPLLSLEGPFQSLSEADATQAYAESLSAVAYVVSRSGEAGLVRILSALGDRMPSEEAIPVALALSYPELQNAWVASLKAADRAPAAN